ncbi:MAG TPA: hypothetical protein VF329_08875 [Gammaproteobacteria bacterium]
MFTRKMVVPGVGAALWLLGALGQQAAATEEIVVDGHEAARAEAQEAEFRTQLDEYVRSLDEQIEVRLNDALKEIVAPKIELASGRDPIRG